MRGIVLATYRARALPTTTRRNKLAPGNQRGSGAPRGASNQCRATPTHVAMSRRFGRGARRSNCTQSAQLICFRGALAFRRSAAALARALTPSTQLQAMLPGTRVEAGVRPLLSQSRDSTSRRGPRAAGRMPKAARHQGPALKEYNFHCKFMLLYEKNTGLFRRGNTIGSISRAFRSGRSICLGRLASYHKSAACS